MLTGLIPIAAACSIFAHTGTGQRTDVSFIDIHDSALRSQSNNCQAEGQNLHSWVGYYWSSKPAPKGWQNDQIVCTVLQPAHSGVDSTLIIVRTNRPGHDQTAMKLCVKLGAT